MTNTLLDGLIAYWPCDEGVGTTAYDVTGGGHNAAFLNSPTWGAGKINTGVVTTYSGVGSGKALSCTVAPNDFRCFNSNMSFSFWGNITTAGGSQGIIGALTNWQFERSGTTNDMVIGTGGGAGNLTMTNGWSAVATGVMQHNVLVYNTNGVSGNIFLYVNGAQSASVATTNYLGASSAITSLRMQSQFDGFGSTGTIDEIGFWTRALTLNEVKWLYNNGSGLQYPFTNNRIIPSRMMRGV